VPVAAVVRARPCAKAGRARSLVTAANSKQVKLAEIKALIHSPEFPRRRAAAWKIFLPSIFSIPQL
jgi:hypothetical protein